MTIYSKKAAKKAEQKAETAIFIPHWQNRPGASFYFNWLENHLQRQNQPEGMEGYLWAVHGGGFYYLKKFAVAPEQLPPALHWFKWEAYWTWLSGHYPAVYDHPQNWLLLLVFALAAVGIRHYSIFDIYLGSQPGH